jgi:hypothetical protein
MVTPYMKGCSASSAEKNMTIEWQGWLLGQLRAVLCTRLTYHFQVFPPSSKYYIITQQEAT